MIRYPRFDAILNADENESVSFLSQHLSALAAQVDDIALRDCCAVIPDCYPLSADGLPNPASSRPKRSCSPLYPSDGPFNGM